MMAKERRTGDDRLTPTSVHLPCAYLDRITELRKVQSEYIRDAVGEKLERDEGFTAAIEILLTDERNMEMDLKKLRKDIDDLRHKHGVWKIEQTEQQLRDRAMTLYVVAIFNNEEELYHQVMENNTFEIVLPESKVREIVKDIWIKEKGSE